MNARKTLRRFLPLSLTLGLFATACDGGSTVAAKQDEKAAADKGEAKADVAKADEAKPEEAKPEEAEPEEAKPEDEKPEESAAEEEKPEEAKAEDEEPEEAAAEEDEEGEEDAEEADEPKAKANKPKADKPKADKPKADKPKADESAASSANGKDIYAKKCKSCHGATGAADTKLAQKHDIASWKEPGWKGKWPQSKVEDIVKNGKSGTKMKAFKDKLTPEEIVAVSTYARNLGK